MKEKKDIKESIWENEYDVLKSLTTIHTKILDQISADYVLCSLSPEDKQGIIDTIGNAQYSIRQIDVILNKAKMHPRWKKQVVPIMKYKLILLKQYLAKPNIVTILNRNRKDNHLLNTLSHSDKAIKEMQLISDDQNKIKNKLTEVDDE